MPFEVANVPAAYDRGPSRPNTTKVIVREGNRFYAQGAELNEIQYIIARRNQRVSDRTIKDGDRIEGADALVDIDAETINCRPGLIYVSGDILPVGAALLEAVPMAGEVTVGVRVVETVVDEDADPTLLGLHAGTAGEGEPGAVRVETALTWGFQGDGGEGDLYSVYLLLDGTIITQAPPPALSGVVEQIARYDWDANGHYIVDGCEVTALGETGGFQLFSIKAGTANIRGFKRIREAAFSLLQEEDPDLEQITGEGHTFTGPDLGATVLTVNRPPVGNVILATVTKRVTENRVRGPVPGGSDALTFASAVEIENVVQGVTTFDPATYTLAGGYISWAPGGAEPVGSSTYDVTYLYIASVVPSLVTDTQITVNGGINGEPVSLTYNSKLPRKDIICLDISGRPVYVKGQSARQGAFVPITPTSLLKLGEVHNDWLNTPVILNNGTRNYTYDEQRKLFNRLIDVLDQFDRAQQEQNILAREPVAKAGIFTDTFVDDFFRDQGEPQTAATNRGVLQLAIDPILLQRVANGPATLAYTEEVVISQTQRTRAQVINPYDNFTAFPAGLTIDPAVDFWTQEDTVWTSPETREFTTAPGQPPGQTTINEVTELRRTDAVFLRQIVIDVLLEGFGAGENLATLTFDGRDVKPGGVQTGDANGEIALTFEIPANVPTGRRLVRATGAAGSFAEAIFVGEGTIDTATMRRVTLIARAAIPPVTIINNITIVQQLQQPVVPPVAAVSVGEPFTPDPLAQSFRVVEPSLICGVNFWIADVGAENNGIRVQLATVLNGYPTLEVLGEAFISMVGVEAGDKIEARFGIPVFLDPTRLYCFVILTADPDHAVWISQLGDIVVETQQRVSSQPYTIGDMFSASNRISWKVHPEADIAFEIVACRFAPLTRTIDLWTGNFEEVSDVIIRGTVEVPTPAAKFRYELIRADASVIPLAPGQTHEFAEYVEEEVTVRAVLDGTARISPILYPGTLIAGGKIRAEGTYVSRVFDMGADVAVKALFAANVPIDASIEVEVDAVDDVWEPLSLGSTGVLGDGWIEPHYEEASFAAPTGGRLKLTLHGGPNARLAVAKLRAYSI